MASPREDPVTRTRPVTLAKGEPIADACHVAGESILLVDDDAALRQLIGEFLQGHGFTVREAESAAAMRAALVEAPCDVIILDVMMPEEDGLSCLRSLQGRSAPAVIMLSTLASDIDRIIGLEIGADDYLAKPCNPRELLARVRSVLRRHALPPAGGDGTFPGRLLLFGGWQLDQQAWTLTDPAGEPVDLSSSEIRLLAALANAHGAVLTRDQLIDAIHGDEGMVFDRAIDIHISRLRRKLAERGGADLIRTVRGAGYSLPAATERR